MSDIPVGAAQTIQLVSVESGLSPGPPTQPFEFLLTFMDRDHAIQYCTFEPNGKPAETTLGMPWVAINFSDGNVDNDIMLMRQTKSHDPPMFHLYKSKPSSYEDSRTWRASGERTQKGNGADLFNKFGVQHRKMHLYLPYRIVNGGMTPSNSKRFALFVVHSTDEVNERRELEQRGLLYIKSFGLIKGKTWPGGWNLLKKMFRPIEIEWLKNQHAGGGHSNVIIPALARLNNQTSDEEIDLTDEIDVIDLT